jgi:DNA-binding NtrC family response regulator
LAQRAVGDEAEPLAEEVVRWIEANLGSTYAWPGNIRELEQCLRNVLIRRTYTPARSAAPPSPADAHEQLTLAIVEGRLTADELLRNYCQLVFAATGSYEATARKLKLDRRTVRAKVGPSTTAT